MTFKEVMTWTSEAFEVLAALVLAFGLVWAVFPAVRAWRRSGDGRRGNVVLRVGLTAYSSPGTPGWELDNSEREGRGGFNRSTQHLA